MISKIKISLSLLFILIVLISSAAIVSANEDNQTIIDTAQDNENILNDEVINVDIDANENNDANYSSSISEAVNEATNNSRIILKDGTYKGSSNTNIIIDKNVTIESPTGNAVIDGENKNAFFKIKRDSTLTLINIKLINGYTSDYNQLGVIKNEGNLIIENSSFSNMKSVMGAIFNEGNLTLTNVEMTESTSTNMAQLLTNIGNATLQNSKLIYYPYGSGVACGVYNYNDLRIINSEITELKSNNQYDEDLYRRANILIENSSLSDVELDNVSIIIHNSKFGGRNIYRNSNINISKSSFLKSSTVLSIFYSNLIAYHSIFDVDISSGYNKLNITYSAILGALYGGGKYDYLYAPYNWWGSNSKPDLSSFKNYSVSLWAIATFEYEYDNIDINPQGYFKTTLNKWSDGNNTYDFEDDETLPTRTVTYEAQNGHFLHSRQYLNKAAYNNLVNNVLDCQIFAVIDSQRLMLVVGNGLSEYTYFVSPEGHDGEEDGSIEKPFLTLQYALKRAGNGNTICLLGGLHKSLANSDLTITKNITLVGLDENVTLLRANDHYMFYVQEWVNFTVKNIKFNVIDRSYTDSIIILHGGELNIINCSFAQITTPNVISTNGGHAVIKDSLFSDIKGSAFSGSAELYIYNSTFEKFTNYYNTAGLESYNAIIPSATYMEIYDSTFRKNSMGIINLHPYYYSSLSLLKAKSPQKGSRVYAYLENTVFEENIFYDISYYSSCGIGLNIYSESGDFNGFINNCSFVNNNGPIAIATNVDNSSFIDNSAGHYSGNALVRADTIYNSIFIHNTNLYRDGDNAFVGEGAASANMILNSTFMYNRAAFGGAVSNTKEIHYSVFVNNTAEYEGNDIYSYKGDVDYSTNWWGDNQKPGSDKIFKFLGTMTIKDWVIMSFEYTSSKEVKASLLNFRDDTNIYPLTSYLPQRLVYFITEGGEINPKTAYLNNGFACADISYPENAQDFKIYARIDNQIMEVNVRNSNTQLIMSDVSVKGANTKFNVTLVNVNGFKIANQNLLVEITDKDLKTQTFTVSTNNEGFGEFLIDYPIGEYQVKITYLGNGYFDRTAATARINVLMSGTYLTAYDNIYYGKNNRFHALLTDENAQKLANFELLYTIIDENGKSKSITVNTDSYGYGEVILNLEVGNYTIICEFLGNSWYESSNATVKIIVKPVNSTMITPNVTFYGKGNIYNITLKDVYGNLIKQENVFVKITQGSASDEFTLKTNDMGVAGLAINYLPGDYNIECKFLGDEAYGPSSSNAFIKIEKVLTTLSGFHYATIPLNGAYNVVLSDMNGRRIGNQSIKLNAYQGTLVKSYSTVTDGTGEANFIIGLEEGNYLFTFEYDGNTWYSDSVGAASIVITKDAILQNIQLNGKDLVQYYGENKYFIINFTDPNAYNQYGKEISVTISSGNWMHPYRIYTDIFGIARIQINLNPGEYDINCKYSNTHYNLFASASNKITVWKMPTTIFANDLIMNVKDTRIFEIHLRDINNNPIKNMQVNVLIDDIAQNITTNDEGIAKLPLSLAIGNHTIYYSINNPNYISSNSSSTVLVLESEKSASKITSNDIEALDNQTINFTVALSDELNNGIKQSRVTLEVTDFDGNVILNTATITDENGQGVFRLNLDYGKYIAKAYYAGNNFYMPSNTVSTINVDASDDKIKTVMYSGEVKLTKSTNYHIVLSDDHGNLIKNAQIKFIIDNREYKTKTDSTGKARLNADLSANVYNLKVVYDGDENYRKSSIATKLLISGEKTQLYAPQLIKYYRNGTQFHALLLDLDNKPLAGKTIQVFLNNNTHNLTTDLNGWISLDINLKPRFYDVECYYYGNDALENSFNKTNITVISTIISQNEIKYYGDSPYLTVKFLNGEGNPINNTQFIVIIDGKSYWASTNFEGIFYFKLNLNSGLHKISVINPYDGLEESYSLNILKTVTASNLVKVIYSNSYYIAQFFDKVGEVLKNKDVSIVIDGIKYSKKTNANGIVKLAMNLKPKTYLITAINPITGEYIENTVKVMASIIKNKNMVMYFGSGKTFKVQIIGNDGKAVGKGKIATFTINGKTYKVKTDKNGYASFKINLSPKKYTITIKYNKYKVSNRITIKPVLTTKDISKKAGLFKFNAKLVNANGKALKGKKITFKIKGKTYTAKTNKNGIASLKLKLKVGKYTIKTSYGKSQITNRILMK